MCFHVRLEEKKNETVDLYPRSRWKNNYKNDNEYNNKNKR